MSLDRIGRAERPFGVLALWTDGTTHQKAHAFSFVPDALPTPQVSWWCFPGPGALQPSQLASVCAAGALPDRMVTGFLSVSPRQHPSPHGRSGLAVGTLGREPPGDPADLHLKCVDSQMGRPGWPESHWAREAALGGGSCAPKGSAGLALGSQRSAAPTFWGRGSQSSRREFRLISLCFPGWGKRQRSSRRPS